MPPKKKANEPSKKTEAKKKEKIIEVHFYFRQNGSFHLNLKSMHFHFFLLFWDSQDFGYLLDRMRFTHLYVWYGRCISIRGSSRNPGMTEKNPPFINTKLSLV